MLKYIYNDQGCLNEKRKKFNFISVYVQFHGKSTSFGIVFFLMFKEVHSLNFKILVYSETRDTSKYFGTWNSSSSVIPLSWLIDLLKSLEKSDTDKSKMLAPIFEKKEMTWKIFSIRYPIKWNSGKSVHPYQVFFFFLNSKKFRAFSV